MNQLIYGQIQGFLMALQSLNHSEHGEYCEFTFAHVPRVGALGCSLTKHMQAVVRTTGRDWHGKPTLQEVRNWRNHLPKKLHEMFFFLRQTSNTATVNSFMELLMGFFEDDNIKVWKLEWFMPGGQSTYSWSVAYPADYVFEHHDEIFHLTLIYSD
jgi:hypothetical protein